MCAVHEQVCMYNMKNKHNFDETSKDEENSAKKWNVVWRFWKKYT